MSIAPVKTAVELRQPPAKAFELFTARMSDWWGDRTVGAKPAVAVTVEPFVGGRWFETDEDGTDTPWGKVLAWEPPSRLLLAWELDSQFRPHAPFHTEVEILFTPTAGGGTRVSLEHRDLERFGSDAERVAGQVGRGWPSHMEEFAAFASTQGETR